MKLDERITSAVDELRQVTVAIPDPTSLIGRPGRRRQRLGTAAVAATMVAAAVVALVAFGLTHGGSDTTSVNAPAGPGVGLGVGGIDPNEAAAQVEAARLARLVVPEPGWKEQGTSPTAVLDQPTDLPTVFEQAIVTRFWTTSTAWATVRASMANDLVDGRGANSSMAYASTGGSTMSNVLFSYAFGPDGLRSTERLVNITSAPLPGGGTGIRADGIAVWRPSRPLSEHIAGGASTVTISAAIGNISPPLASVTVTNQTKITALERSVDAVPHLSDTTTGTLVCRTDFGLRLTVVFNGLPAARTVSLILNPTCHTVSVTSGGADRPFLQDDAVAAQAAKLLGTSVAELQARAHK
jgi:hypothetical protein